MEFDLVIIEVSFCEGRLLIYMEFKRLCHNSIYSICLIRKFISIICYYDFREDSILMEDDFGFIVNDVLNNICSLTRLTVKCDLELINLFIKI